VRLGSLVQGLGWKLLDAKAFLLLSSDAVCPRLGLQLACMPCHAGAASRVFAGCKAVDYLIICSAIAGMAAAAAAQVGSGRSKSACQRPTPRRLQPATGYLSTTAVPKATGRTCHLPCWLPVVPGKVVHRDGSFLPQSAAGMSNTPHLVPCERTGSSGCRAVCSGGR
jgi:hypothetical protein